MYDASNESEGMHSCLETLDVLSSLFCMEGELTLDEETVEEVKRMREGRHSASFEELRCTIRVAVTNDDDHGADKDTYITLRVRLHPAKRVQMTLGHPAWMARKQFQQLSEQLYDFLSTGTSADTALDPTATVLEAVEFVREHGTSALADTSHRNTQEEASSTVLETDNPTGSLVCVRVFRPDVRVPTLRFRSLLHSTAGSGCTSPHSPPRISAATSSRMPRRTALRESSPRESPACSYWKLRALGESKHTCPSSRRAHGPTSLPVTRRSARSYERKECAIRKIASSQTCRRLPRLSMSTG